MDVGVPRCWNGSSVLVSTALVDPQRGGQTTLSASQVAAGSKRLRIVELGTPYKRPMSSSGRLIGPSSGAQSERECESPPEPAPPEVPPRGPSLHVTLRHRPAPDQPADSDRLFLSEDKHPDIEEHSCTSHRHFLAVGIELWSAGTAPITC
ncbi:jg11642 [Pararge aegeria aegeria]|uniref:Jg11642 protein n=1 Tax=Pararge aegeria aegeria TaxID=348720 RepID=A0A8S4RNA9_9NEOP|nr:jg11642 [Pararge aegeria aegeria]